jgi:hypothetical protein
VESQQIETPMHYLKEADAIGIQHMLGTSTNVLSRSQTITPNGVRALGSLLDII